MNADKRATEVIPSSGMHGLFESCGYLVLNDRDVACFIRPDEGLALHSSCELDELSLRMLWLLSTLGLIKPDLRPGQLEDFRHLLESFPSRAIDAVRKAVDICIVSSHVMVW